MPSFTRALSLFIFLLFPFFSSQAADFPKDPGQFTTGRSLRMERVPTDPVWVLSIDGGGIRGLIPATILANIESQVNIILDRYWRERIAESSGSPYRGDIPPSFKVGTFFDLLAGTSTGGIIALGLSSPHPDDPSQPLYQASDLAKLYKDNGATIFPPASLGSGIGSVFGYKYDARPLEGLFQAYFGNIRLKQAIRPLIITGYEMRQEQLCLFDSLKAQKDDAEDYLVRDVARATSAAPTYFNAAIILNGRKEERLMADGGIVANNPSMAAYVKARQVFPEASKIYLLSIGTGVTVQDDLSTLGKSGLLGWGPKIASVMMDGSSEFTHNLLSQMASSPDLEYLRLQPKIAKARGEMDVTEADNMAYLEALTKRFIGDAPALNHWIEHIASACKGKCALFPGLASEVALQIKESRQKVGWHEVSLPNQEIDTLKAWQISLTLSSVLPNFASDLISLNLQDNALTLESLKPLRGFANLKMLDVSNNRQLTLEAADLIAASFPNLTSLYVNRVPLGTEGIIVLARTLKNLIRFHAASTHKGDGAVSVVPYYLTSLTDLNFSRNGLSPEGVKSLLTRLPNLECLALSNRGAFPVIIENLPHNLTRLSLDHMDLSSSGPLEPLVERKPGLLSLNLQFNAFEADSGSGLGEIAHRLANLQTLILSNNNLQDGGVRDLTERLANHHSLTHLSVDRNNITLEGIRALFASLQPLQILRSLNIQHNAIRNEQRPDYRRLCENFQRQKPYLSLVWED